MIRVLTTVFAILLFAPLPAAAQVQGGGGEITVQILNIDGVEAFEFDVQVDEPFTLVGDVLGDPPITYGWFQDEVLIGETFLLQDHSISAPGIHTIVLWASDVNGLEDADTCYVNVEPGAVPTRRASWGGIKDLYQRP